jgi:hypothetical protein
MVMVAQLFSLVLKNVDRVLLRHLQEEKTGLSRCSMPRAALGGNANSSYSILVPSKLYRLP